MRIITRAEWNARPPKTPPRTITAPSPDLWLHHAAVALLPDDDSLSDADMRRVRSIQNYHMDVRGWNDIAYNFLLDPDGHVFEGRGAGIRGAHTAGHNTTSHAICVMGNYNTQIPEDDLLSKIAEFIVYGHGQGWWPDQLTGGHRDASGASTSCPGTHLYSQIPEINRRAGQNGGMPLDQIGKAVVDIAFLLGASGDRNYWYQKEPDDPEFADLRNVIDNAQGIPHDHPQYLKDVKGIK